MSKKIIEGAAAPDFTAPCDGGDTLQLSSLKGKNIVLKSSASDGKRTTYTMSAEQGRTSQVVVKKGFVSVLDARKLYLQFKVDKKQPDIEITISKK